MHEIQIIGHRGYGATNRRDNAAVSIDLNGHNTHLYNIDSGYKYRLPKIPDEWLNYPENSLFSYFCALDVGADGVELDVIVTKDGVPMVIHDDELNRNVVNADRKGKNLGLISERTYDEIKDLEIGFGQKIPTLYEVLDLVDAFDKQYRKDKTKSSRVIIELKSDKAAEAVYKAYEHYTKTANWRPEQFTICSFNYDYLRDLRRQNADIHIGPGIKSKFLFGDDGVDADYKVLKRDYEPDAINALSKLHDELHFSTLFPVNTDIKKELITFAKANGLEIMAWTWNEKPPAQNIAQIRELVQHRKQYPNINIMTDYPCSLRKRFNENSFALRGGVS